MTTMVQPFCRICNNGVLVMRKTYRMSGIVVLIGYILLIPSFIGMAIGVLGLFATGSTAGTSLVTQKQQISSRLQAADIPGVIIDKVVEDAPISEQRLAPLTSDQKRLVRDCQLELSAASVGTGLGIAVVGGIAIFVCVVSLVGGLLGWILVMKKKVLQCTCCGAVVAAS